MKTYAGYIAILGRPNVGKSTLLNYILGTKISITSKKAQTTRHRILGIKTENNIQAIYVDTPGIHHTEKRALNKIIVKTALNSLNFVDVVVFLLDSRGLKEEDYLVLKHLQKRKLPVIVALNKMDRLTNKNSLFPLTQTLQQHFQELGIIHVDFVPISAKTGENICELENLIQKKLPENPFFYEEDDLTDKNDRFICSEIIREKMLRSLGAEVPHDIAIEIEFFKEKPELVDISAVIWVSRAGQKKIIIGDKGARLKEIGARARRDIEQWLEKKVMLRLWIKVKKNWSDDERALKSLGFGDEL